MCASSRLNPAPGDVRQQVQGAVIERAVMRAAQGDDAVLVIAATEAARGEVCGVAAGSMAHTTHGANRSSRAAPGSLR
jgi:hypothetical protein